MSSTPAPPYILLLRGKGGQDKKRKFIKINAISFLVIHSLPLSVSITGVGHSNNRSKELDQSNVNCKSIQENYSCRSSETSMDLRKYLLSTSKDLCLIQIPFVYLPRSRDLFRFPATLSLHVPYIRFPCGRQSKMLKLSISILSF